MILRWLLCALTVVSISSKAADNPGTKQRQLDDVYALWVSESDLVAEYVALGVPDTSTSEQWRPSVTRVYRSKAAGRPVFSTGGHTVTLHEDCGTDTLVCLRGGGLDMAFPRACDVKQWPREWSTKNYSFNIVNILESQTMQEDIVVIDWRSGSKSNSEIGRFMYSVQRGLLTYVSRFSDDEMSGITVSRVLLSGQGLAMHACAKP